MSTSYRRPVARWWHTVTDAQVAAIVLVVVVGIWTRRPLPVLALGIVAVTLGVRRVLCATAIVVGLLGVVASQYAWSAVRPDHLGPFDGVACLVTDPAPVSGAMAVVLEIDGERFEAWARGSPRRRLGLHLAGECVSLVGERRVLVGFSGRRAAIRHVVGRLDIKSLGDWSDGGRMDRASNRVRRLFGRGSALLRQPDDSLFAGLVIGDDRNEPAAMVDEFRASGLAHLTAVSGQNVSYVLAAAAPVLRRTRPWLRWVLTIGLITWFAALTRFEPSVLRAGVMAGIAATGVVFGRERPPGRILALAVGLLVLVDPLLVWSVGFWLSVGATGGVALFATRLARCIPGPDWVAIPAGVTLAAQIGVAPVSLLMFGSLPIVSIPANLLAVPVAGVVMLYGLPAGLAAGALANGPAAVVATLLQIPSGLGTRWVATVASLAARLEPSGRLVVAGWVTVVVVIGARLMMIRRRRVCEGVG